MRGPARLLWSPRLALPHLPRPNCPRRRLCPSIPHIYGHNTQHAIKASSAGIWDVYTRTDNVCPALLSPSLSIFDSSVSFQTSVRPGSSLFVLSMGLLDPVPGLFWSDGAYHLPTCRHIVHKLSNTSPKALPMSGPGWRPFISALKVLGLFVTTHNTYSWR